MFNEYRIGLNIENNRLDKIFKTMPITDVNLTMGVTFLLIRCDVSEIFFLLSGIRGHYHYIRTKAVIKILVFNKPNPTHRNVSSLDDNK